MKQGNTIVIPGSFGVEFAPYVPVEKHKYTLNRQYNTVTFKDSKRQACTINRNVLSQSSHGLAAESLLSILIDKHPEFNISLTQENVKALLPILQKFASTGKL